ncbi:hypothetical protein ACP0GC_24635, partial [Escherichia coli]
IEYTENIDFYSSILELINNKYPKTIFIQKLKEKGFLIDNDELENLLLYWKKMNIIKSEEAEIDQIIKNKNYQKYDRQIKNFATLPNLT